MDCKVAKGMMHSYLDGELPREEIFLLREHVSSCPSCSKHLDELEKTDAAVYMAFETMKAESKYDEAASSELYNRIMMQIPNKKKKKSNFIRKLYKYPLLTAAVVFLIVIAGGLFSPWGDNKEMKLSVSNADSQQLVLEGNTVIVPEGAHISGNLIVENGKVEVRGEVEGNITVVDGSMMLASTGKIAGEVKEIDQALDWFWYKIISAFSGLTP